MTVDGSPPILELRISAASRAICAVFGIGCAAGTVFATAGFFTRPDVGLVVVALLCLAGTLFFVWLTAWCFLRRLRLFSWGFQNRTVFAESQVTFGEIEKVVLPAVSTIGVDPIGRATFHSPVAKISLGGFELKKSLEVGSFALSRVVPLLADAIETKLRGSEEVKLGKTTLSHLGITVGGSTVAWNHIEHANFSPEGLRVFPRGRPESTLVIGQGTPNLHVIVELAARKIAAAEQAPATSMSAPGAPMVSPATGERVRGFPDLDPELGALVCGQGRPGVVRIVVGVLTLGLAAVAVLPIGAEFRIVVLIIAAVLALVWFGMGFGGFAVYERGARGVKKRVLFAETDHLTYHVVDQYQNGVYAGRRVGLDLESPTGKVSFNGMGAKNEGVCTAVLDRVLPGLVERKWRDLEAGREIRVDKLVLERGKIRWKKEELPISEVQSIEARQGFLHVWKQGREMSWAVVNLGARDARLLAPLLERLLAKR